MQACSAFAPTSCAPPSSGSSIEGRTLGGRYRVGRVIGAGAMGRVFAAEHVDLGRACAVKVIRQPDDERGERDALECAETIARFRTEALAASRMDHPNVLRVLDFGREPDGMHYLVTEQLDGIDLIDLMSQEERLEPPRAARIVRQICSALQHAHDRGVVHRDIKPENVRVVRREGDDGKVTEVVKLLDFGTAFLSDGTAPSGRLVIGTPAYMSPEQASGDRVDARTDVYAMGVLMFELATGRLPFERSSAVALAAAHIECPPPAPSSLDERVSPALESIILSCLQKDPSKRPQSARRLRDALDRWLAEFGVAELDRSSGPEITIEVEEPTDRRALRRTARVSRLRPRMLAAVAAARRRGGGDGDPRRRARPPWRRPRPPSPRARAGGRAAFAAIGPHHGGSHGIEGEAERADLRRARRAPAARRAKHGATPAVPTFEVAPARGRGEGVAAAGDRRPVLRRRDACRLERREPARFRTFTVRPRPGHASPRAPRARRARRRQARTLPEGFERPALRLPGLPSTLRRGQRRAAGEANDATATRRALCLRHGARRRRAPRGRVRSAPIAARDRGASRRVMRPARSLTPTRPMPVEPDQGYGESHGYGPAHGGPTGPADAPAPEATSPDEPA